MPLVFFSKHNLDKVSYIVMRKLLFTVPCACGMRQGESKNACGGDLRTVSGGKPGQMAGSVETGEAASGDQAPGWNATDNIR